MLEVTPFSVPPAGTDTVDITIEETYSVEGVGSDTVTLSGSLVAERATPLIDPARGEVEWETSLIVANFVSLDVRGESEVFGPVHVALDRRSPSFAAVGGGHCRAVLSISVSMPKQGLVLHSSEPVQLHSQVETVPPIGDERTESLRSVTLIDLKERRERGSIDKARVVWRNLMAQVEA